MKKIHKIICAIILSVLLIAGVSVYAYYATHDSGKQINANVNITEDNVIEVTSFNDLIKKGTASKYNDSDAVSETSARTILQLGANITLQSNVVLTSDIHLDLNGKTLNLNDHTITFKHGYAGCFSLYNGTIEAGKEGNGKVVIDLPKAGFQTDSLTFTSNGAEATQASIVTVLNLDRMYTAYSAIYLAANSFDSDLRTRPEFKTYSEISGLSSLTSDLFIKDKLNCSLNANTGGASDTHESCSFVYKDLDYIYSYLSTDISISYTSSDTDIINSLGRLTKTKYGNVNLTVTVAKTGWDPVSVTFPIHVVNLSVTETKQAVGIELIKAYLSDYYVKGDLIVKDEAKLTGYYYNFNHAINLPKTALDGNIVFGYSTTNEDGDNNTNAVIYLDPSDATSYIFGPTLADYHLVITIAEKGTSLNIYSTYVGLQETISYLIVNSLYGGAIVYDKTSVGKTLIQRSDIMAATKTDSNTDDDYLVDLQSYFTDYNITALTYTLKGDVKTHYDIIDNVLTIKDGVTPAEKESAITITLTFGTVDFSIDLTVDYLDSSGSTLSNYLTYYSIYNAGVPSQLQTYFDMPFATNGIAPYTVYDVATYTTEKVVKDEETTYTKVNETLSKPANLKVALWYNGEEKLVFTEYNPTNRESFSNQLDSYLETNNLTLRDIAGYTGDKKAFYRFSIVAQNSVDYNQNLTIIYNYKFNSTSTTWTRYQNDDEVLTDTNTTYFTALGGLFYSTTGKTAGYVNYAGNTVAGQTVDYAVKDGNFFIWIYNKFRPDLATYGDDIDAASTDIIIPVDWLGQDLTITKSDTGLNSVLDFSGIKYLTGVTKVNLSGSESISVNVLNGISEMKSIQELYLSNCKLTSVSQLSRLSAQSTLRILDISNNSIQYFDDITSITSLEKVYLQKNNETNAYYGSKGICNFQAFADLMRNGCSVYYDLSGTIPILYAESSNLDDYKRLKEIAYQDILKTGLDITKLYESFFAMGTTITDVSSKAGNNPFGLKKAGTLSWGYQGDDNDSNKYVEAKVTVGATRSGTYYEMSNGSYVETADTTFLANKTYYQAATTGNATYFYVTLTYTDGGYKMTVKYYVDRN